MLRILVTDLPGIFMSEADDFFFFHRILEKEFLSSFYNSQPHVTAFIVFNTISNKEV